MSKSKIEWTTDTWNPVTGCTRVSSGCDNCYAVGMTRRLAGMPQTKEKYGGLINEGKNHFNGTIKLHNDELIRPLKWKKPRTIFVNSMSDLFHPEVPFVFIAAVFGVMAYCKDHTFQVLTKRPERMAEFFKWLKKGEMKTEDGEVLDYDETQKCVTMAIHKIKSKDIILMGMTNVKGRDWPIPNVWLGTSVENQQTANERIPHLLRCSASVRFLSCEPLLGPVKLTNMDVELAGDPDWCFIDCLTGEHNDMGRPCKEVPTIQWVIVGGESGPNARPIEPEWIRSLRDQCGLAKVPFFFKQWGEYAPFEETAQQPNYRSAATGNEYDAHGLNFIDPMSGNRGRFNGLKWLDQLETSTQFLKAGKYHTGRLLDGVEWNGMPGIKEGLNECQYANGCKYKGRPGFNEDTEEA